jgi:hypothetical protein
MLRTFTSGRGGRHEARFDEVLRDEFGEVLGRVVPQRVVGFEGSFSEETETTSAVLGNSLVQPARQIATILRN